MVALGYGTAAAVPQAAARHTASPNPCTAQDHLLTIAVTTDAKNVAVGDRLWDSHARFVRSTHQSFLVAYGLAKGPERADPLDPASALTGRTVYVLNECYRTSADISRHWKITSTRWPEFQAVLDWMHTPGTQVVTLHDGQVRNSLW
ncbi:hypothetical protein [Streptomyces sp. NPDC088910]|uniref:hypothetical protein n=1 Tax=Streptomyces sp. NPDC088910 TaxID=3365911 RepID=UPI00380D6391